VIFIRQENNPLFAQSKKSTGNTQLKLLHFTNHEVRETILANIVTRNRDQ